MVRARSAGRGVKSAAAMIFVPSAILRSIILSDPQTVIANVMRIAAGTKPQRTTLGHATAPRIS